MSKYIEQKVGFSKTSPNVPLKLFIPGWHLLHLQAFVHEKTSPKHSHSRGLISIDIIHVNMQGQQKVINQSVSVSQQMHIITIQTYWIFISNTCLIGTHPENETILYFIILAGFPCMSWKRIIHGKVWFRRPGLIL